MKLKNPPMIVSADEVTEEHLQWTIARFYNMRAVRPVEWDKIPMSKLGAYFGKVLRKDAKLEVLRQMEARGWVRKVEEHHRRARRVEKSTYYEITEGVLDGTIRTSAS